MAEMNPDRIGRQYSVRWTSMVRTADGLWNLHIERLIDVDADPEDLVALFGLSYVVEQLESSWDLNNLGKLRSAKTTLRSALEGLFQMAAVAHTEDPGERRTTAIKVLGQEISQKLARIRQIRANQEMASIDPELLESWEEDLTRKSERFKSEFGIEPTRIPISELAEMGGIGGHYFAYMEDKMFSHPGVAHLEKEPGPQESLKVKHDCCNLLLATLDAACDIMDHDIDHLLEPHERRINDLAKELREMFPAEDQAPAA